MDGFLEVLYKGVLLAAKTRAKHKHGISDSHKSNILTKLRACGFVKKLFFWYILTHFLSLMWALYVFHPCPPAL